MEKMGELLARLVSDLPKMGGWPEWAVECILHRGSCKAMFYDDGGRFNGYPSFPDIKFREEALEERIVYREMYESALTAGKPEWDGEGLPPVECRVEANYGGEWVEATVAYTDRPESHSDAVAWKEALVFDCKTTRPFWADEFRHIRSEADKKRDEAVFAIAELCRGSASNGHSAELIYDAIKSGKIVID